MVPVVVLPGRPPIPGFNVKALGAALGLAAGPAPAAAATGASAGPAPETHALAAPPVLESFDRILTAILQAAGRLSDADLALRLPNRDRNLGELIHDIFFKVLTWAPETGPTVPRHAEEQRADAARYPGAAALLAYGEATRAALRRRFAPGRLDYGRIVETGDGPLPLADAVTWLADHSAHHLRQIYWLMEHRLGITPGEPLDLAALPGITLQEQLW